jgi:hypothetical protein
VVALDVVVLDEVVDDAAQMTLAEWDNVTEAFFAYRCCGVEHPGATAMHLHIAKSLAFWTTVSSLALIGSVVVCWSDGVYRPRRLLWSSGTTFPPVASCRASSCAASVCATSASPILTASRMPRSSSASGGSDAAAKRGGRAPDAASTRAIELTEGAESCSIVSEAFGVAGF